MTQAVRLRDEDTEECRLGGMTPEEAIGFSVRKSTMAFIIDSPDGVPAAYWGYRDDCIIGGRCFAWMLSTPELDRWPRWAARESKILLDMILQTHYRIDIQVDSEYTKSVRWLEWLGFVRHPTTERLMFMTYTRGGAA